MAAMETNQRHVATGPELITSADLDQMPQTPGLCFRCERDAMVYALIEPTCLSCALADIAAFGCVFGRTSPVRPSGQRPPSALAAQMVAVCANCRKPIRRSAAGADWLHRRNGSASCYPGQGSWKRANPREVA